MVATIGSDPVAKRLWTAVKAETGNDKLGAFIVKSGVFDIVRDGTTLFVAGLRDSTNRVQTVDAPTSSTQTVDGPTNSALSKDTAAYVAGKPQRQAETPPPTNRVQDCSAETEMIRRISNMLTSANQPLQLGIIGNDATVKRLWPEVRQMHRCATLGQYVTSCGVFNTQMRVTTLTVLGVKDGWSSRVAARAVERTSRQQSQNGTPTAADHVPALMSLKASPLASVDGRRSSSSGLPAKPQTAEPSANKDKSDCGTQAKLLRMRQASASTSSLDVQVHAKSKKPFVSTETLLVKRCVAVLTSHGGSMFLAVLGQDAEVKDLWQKVRARNGEQKLKTFLLSYKLFSIEHDGLREVITFL